MACWASIVGAVNIGKISAFQPQGPQFDPQIGRDLNISANFFST